MYQAMHWENNNEYDIQIFQMLQLTYNLTAKQIIISLYMWPLRP